MRVAFLVTLHSLERPIADMLAAELHRVPTLNPRLYKILRRIKIQWQDSSSLFR